ncbi:unnamed protein product [Rhizoctonia solani]|uniref:Calcineurin-like phosphoesterase domain-containing protein n=1 Tax=Rhizoctonia solani TaxID=456999 RepID=A0A8H2WVN6_9AGAM|nr:unnamed protein product [Rhizoctonia solani]
MTYTRKIIFLSVFQAAILGCNAKLTPGQPRGPLPWGDINILHTSDTHGWLLGHTKNQWPEPNYSGTYGDFISFVGHMKKLAEEKDVDLLLVDSGDLHDGSGLTDGYPKGGINGEEAIKSFLKVPYDVMAIGKSRKAMSYTSVTADVTLDIYNNFAPKLDGRYLSSNSYLTTTFKNGSSVEHIIGSRYRRFKTLRGRQVTSLGVIFDFKEHNINTTIHNPGKMVAEAWFQELMLQPTDIFVLTGHMSALQGDWAIVTNAIRKHHPTTPIAALGGHAHIRFCHQFDSNTMLLESGRFMETVGWMGISLNKTYPESPASFERRYLDANRITYMYHSNTTEQNFDSEVGIEVDLFNQKLTARWNLGKVHGCASQDYFVERYPWPHPQNLYAFYIFQVLPEVLVKTSGRADKPYVTLVNNGMLRFDIYRGTFTWNDQLTVLPFKEGYLYIEVPWSIAQNIKDKLYEYPKDHLNAARILTEKFGSTVDATLPEHLAQALLSAPSNLSPGYVTEDDCGGNGDDTEHIPIPRSNNSDYMSNDPFYPIPHNASVDFIMPVFLGKRVLEAINKLGHPATWEDMHQYGNVTSKEVFAKYFEHFPAINNECPED